MNLEGLPKLLPLWHDVTLKERSYRDWYIDYNSLPDHGGAGIDLSIFQNMEQSEELKSSVNIAKFGSDSCSLPFLPPNKVEKLNDPCLERLNRQKVKLKGFCQKLDAIRCSMSKVASREFRNIILAAHEEASLSSENPKDIDVPLSVFELSKLFPKKFPVPRAHWSYAGGCLTTLPISSTSHLLLHPIGKDFNKIALTPVNEVHCTPQMIIASKNQQKKVKLEGGPIYGITAESPESCFCVRQKKRFHYFSLDFSNNDFSHSMETFEIGEEISSISMSNYIPGETLVMLKNGTLSLQNAEQRRSIWQLDEPLSHNTSVKDMWWGCGFGSHPRSVLYCDRLCFSALDLRVKRSKSINLFSFPNPFALDSENIMLIKKFGEHDFQHLVATDVHLFIFDERYPQQPVMSWNHMLSNFPIYCDIQPYAHKDGNSDCIVLLGTQESQDIASFHVRTQSSRIQPFSLALPLHLSKPCDSIETLRHHCQQVDEQHVKRLSLPLIGLRAIPHSTSVGYTVLQATSLGDVFYQDFKPSLVDGDEKTFRIGPDCIIKPPDAITARLNGWLKKANPKKNEKNSSGKLNNKIVFAYVNKKGILKSKRKALPECPICNSNAASFDVNQESSDSNICSLCGLDINYAKNLMKASKNFQVLAGQSSSKNQDDLNISSLMPKSIDFTKMCDPLSQRFLKPWLEEDVTMTLYSMSQLEDAQETHTIELNPSMFDLENCATQPYQEELTYFQPAMNRSFPVSGSQVLSDTEDIIPPSQEPMSGLYSARKKKKPKKVSTFSSGF